MSYQFTKKELLEMESKMPKYKKHIFFEKKNKYALLISVINEGERFISQVNKMKYSYIIVNVNGIEKKKSIFLCLAIDKMEKISYNRNRK